MIRNSKCFILTSILENLVHLILHTFPFHIPELRTPGTATTVPQYGIPVWQYGVYPIQAQTLTIGRIYDCVTFELPVLKRVWGSDTGIEDRRIVLRARVKPQAFTGSTVN